MKILELSDAEFEHFKTAVEGAVEELEELEREVDWYTTETIDRLNDCLVYLNRAAKGSDRSGGAL